MNRVPKKKIILASSSPQRKKLLKALGIQFSVCPSHIEEKTKIQTTCAAFVKHNALKKAEAVAQKRKQGVVIGADTTVFVGKQKILGKPKDYKDAKRILKILFSRPQWVYTGVAVIDVDSGKKFVDYERTKVFMTHLSGKEIDEYHKKVKPFDKAGGFDIEGWGSSFIGRIEGCYTNVIGLPMAKLAQMLKKVGVSILGVLMIIFLSGCVTEYNLATQKEERLLYGTEKEVKIGDSVAQKIEARYTVVDDVDVNERVERIFDLIVDVSDRKDLVYFVKVLDDEMMNAISLPGGYVYVFKGLVDNVDNDDQLAGVLAHEMGHITAKHGIKRVQSMYGAIALQVLANSAGGGMSAGVNFALSSLFTQHSQKDELEADRLGVKYMREAGYNPTELLNFLDKLEEEHRKAPIRRFSYWRTHPHIPQRKAAVNQEITGKLEFKDYIHLIGTEE